MAHHHLADLRGARYPIGLATAEFGRQPWVVYPSVTGPEGVELLTADGISLAVSGWELIATIVLFVLIYLVLFIAWARIVAAFHQARPHARATSSRGCFFEFVHVGHATCKGSGCFVER